MNPLGQARRVLRQVHLWMGLTLCIPLVVLGLTGSILVFRSQLANLLDPPPHLTCRPGKPHTAAEIIAAAQAGIGKQFTPTFYEAPDAPQQPATVRLVALEGAASGPRVVIALVDPVSLKLARWNYNGFPGFLIVILELHRNLLLGDTGRGYVGWLGVGMLALGISGFILWWPRPNKWRAAFVVKRGARGLRLYRDLHGAVGIWAFAVFITVGFSGVYFAFPRTVSAGIKAVLPSRDTGGPAVILKGEGAQRIDADHAIAAALSAAPGSRLISIVLPVQPNLPYRVSLANADDGRGAPEMVALINPRSGQLIELIGTKRFAPAQAVLALQPMLHFGQGLGWVWRILVCLSGLLPAIFAFTGIAMWLIKRRARRRAARTAVPRLS